MPDTPPQDVADDLPPKPLPIELAHTGKSGPEIASEAGFTHPGVFLAIRRLKVQHLLFRGKRLYSPEQATYIVSHMTRRPDPKPLASATACPPR